VLKGDGAMKKLFVTVAAVAVYLFISVMTGGWAFTWIIWVFYAVYMIYEVYKANQ